MKCLVVNLDRSIDRLPHVTKEFGKLGVNFERVSAVDWHDLKDTAISRIVKRSPKFKPLTYPTIACFLSHKKCWQMIVDGQEDYVAVFEDDVIFSEKAAKFLLDSNWIPAGTKMIKIETELSSVVVGKGKLSIDNEYDLRVLAGPHNGTCGYIISKDYATYLLSVSHNLNCQVDIFLFDPRAKPMRENDVLQLVPAVCIQKQFYAPKEEDFGSTIVVNGRERYLKDESKGMLQKLVREIRRPIFKHTLKFYDEVLPMLIYYFRRQKLDKITVDFI